MEIVHKILGANLYVRLCGELNDSTSGQMRDALDKLIEDFQGTKLVLNMSALKFIDSTGVGVLIGRYKKLKNKGAELVIDSPSPTVDETLSLVGFLC